MGACVQLPNSCWVLFWLGLVQALCMLSLSLWVHMGQSCCMWSTWLFPCCHPSSLALNVSLTPLLNNLLPEPWGVMLDKIIPFKADCSKVSSLSLHIVQLWVSVFVPNYCRRSSFDNGPLPLHLTLLLQSPHCIPKTIYSISLSREILPSPEVPYSICYM